MDADSAIDVSAEAQEEFPPLKPSMTRDEVVLLTAVASRRESVVEFGCGGSTAVLVGAQIPSIISVESDEAWVSKLRNHPDLGEALETGRLDLIHADIGPVGSWGRPRGTTNVDMWPNYWAAVWDHPTLTERGPDFVFVDGRFRVACALGAALRVRTNAPIAVHDFWKRDYYHVVLDHLDVVATADELVVLTRKPDFEPARVAIDLGRHVTDVR